MNASLIQDVWRCLLKTVFCCSDFFTSRQIWTLMYMCVIAVSETSHNWKDANLFQSFSSVLDKASTKKVSSSGCRSYLICIWGGKLWMAY